MDGPIRRKLHSPAFISLLQNVNRAIYQRAFGTGDPIVRVVRTPMAQTHETSSHPTSCILTPNAHNPLARSKMLVEWSRLCLMLPTYPDKLDHLILVPFVHVFRSHCKTVLITS